MWIDYTDGKMYISNDYINNQFVFAMTTEDHEPNTMLYSMAKQYNCWTTFIKSYKLGVVYFESIKIKNICKEVMKNLVLRS